MTKAQTIAEEIYFEIEFAEDAPEHFWGEDTVIEFAVKVAEKYAKSQLKPQEGEREICQCENPVPQATLSHACQNCYKTLREYSQILKQ